MDNGRDFFRSYAPGLAGLESITVLDVGSQDVNGSLRDVCPPEFSYIGIDSIPARNVDVVLDDPYTLPFTDASADMVVSSSCFEHSEHFWLMFLEILRVLKPHGLFYLNAPSQGPYHRYPVDCWRFYPDSGKALVAWGTRQGYQPALLETYTQVSAPWHDQVAVFLKDAHQADRHPRRILNSKTDFVNGRLGNGPLLRPQTSSRRREWLPRWPGWHRLIGSVRGGAHNRLD